MRSVFDNMQASSQNLNQVTQSIKLQIDQSLVHFQFQDRIGQVLSHVRDSINQVPQLIVRSHADGVALLKPIGAKDLLDSLKSSYTMVEEHHAHDPKATHQTPAEITFF